ncbi:MAG: carboxypeptidase M32 [Spirochaetales bacterium]|nr:carboxypeptidase M32 [Spirochaetales bacterium]MCF7938123.1 carboxypeptidase M32 [Spirochaetales bacterium]
MSQSAREKAIERLREIGREIYLLSHVNALLGWDQETYMPRAAVEERAEQLSVLEGMIHDRITSEELGELLELLGAEAGNPGGSSDLLPVDRALVRHVYRHYTRQTRIPGDLVRAIARQVGVSQQVWAEARKASDFSRFRPELETMMELTTRKAEALGYKQHPYDALVDEFEPEMTTARLTDLFDSLGDRLSSLLDRISAVPQVENDFLFRTFPEDRQRAFSRSVISELGYCFDRGRLDQSTHPFTTSLGADDVRITNRYLENFFNAGIFGSIHEAGHGLYELGFGEEIRGNLLADGTSLGIHESQSRFWENMVGRSRSFWEYYLPRARSHFPGVIDDIDLERWYRGINRVEPSLIRVEADEVTYSLHIVLRFRLETALLSGDLQVGDLPEAWREQSSSLLGVVPESDADGVLQDIHWSMGAVGYFPTYALGNLYAAQFRSALLRDYPGLDSMIASGDFKPVLKWLRQKIHRHGSALTPGELCRQVTGGGLSADFFIDYLEDKYGEIYRLNAD